MGYGCMTGDMAGDFSLSISGLQLFGIGICLGAGAYIGWKGMQVIVTAPVALWLILLREKRKFGHDK